MKIIAILKNGHFHCLVLFFRIIVVFRVLTLLCPRPAPSSIATHVVFKVVNDRLFTGSHDGTIKVWDIFGIKEDAGMPPQADGDDDDETKIILDDDYPYGDNDEDYYDESMFLSDSPELHGKANKDVMDMV